MKTHQKTALRATAVVSAAALVSALAAPLGAAASEVTFLPPDANKDGFVTTVEQRHHEMGLWAPGDPVPAVIAMPYADDMRLPDGRIDPGNVGGM